mmetsp:Transcript_2567/g.6322  ORF Transcript_2567/g.6322 Transcript_2567/m.6322 type:complete len:215 (-) Transcript_2567:596-1240(-)
MPGIRHILQSGALLGALRNPEVFDCHHHLSTAFSALLFLLLHANNLLAKGRHGVLGNLNLLRRAPAAVLALVTRGVGSAAAADDRALELVALLRHPVVQLHCRDGHLNIQVVVPHLRLNLVLHPRLFELLLLLFNLGLELSVLRMVLGNLVQLGIQLSLLPIHLLPSCLDVLHQLDAAGVVIPTVVLVAQNLVCFPDLVEDLRIATLVGVVRHR